METAFRFQNLRIWREAVDLLKDTLQLVKILNEKKLFGFSNQLERASLSIANNIAEGSGSSSDKDFASFLNISRRSLFECVNILIVMQETDIISKKEYDHFNRKYILLAKQISSLRNHLLNSH